MNRQEILDGLRQSPKVDVLVIGGGINGISVFRELALQGRRRAAGRETRLLLRAPVRRCRAWCMAGCAISKTASSSWCSESLVERDRLLRNAPHYVAPLPTTVPVFDIFSGLGNGAVRFLGLSRRPSRRGAIVIKAGLTHL